MLLCVENDDLLQTIGQGTACSSSGVFQFSKPHTAQEGNQLLVIRHLQCTSIGENGEPAAHARPENTLQLSRCGLADRAE